ncbi:MAG: toll/interleukin-1 receptor domain-containing protein [Tateyamaria sp.]|uniref:toll/interleukin-1 receptor domain-containing protein n=1 Tax=Tateyamaria sp. TaxID=1929288 RepID=UPI00329AF22D
MPIFISYNHEDKSTAESLAKILVQAKQNVWIDQWELNAGDSLIQRIEEALGGADAILVLLSKNSTQSEWCKKELRSGLLRELEEKSVLVIPIVLDDCEIPLFVREKLWIDFRKNRDEQLALLLRSLDRISNPAQGRTETPDFHVDWAMTHVSFDNQNGMEWVFVDHSEKFPYVVMTQVLMFPLGDAADEYEELEDDDARYQFSAHIMDAVLDTSEDLQVLLDSEKPDVRGFILGNNETGEQARIQLTVRRLGADNGMDTLVHVESNLKRAVEHTLGVVREST